MTDETPSQLHDTLRRYMGSSPAFALPRWLYLQHARELKVRGISFRPRAAMFATYPISIVIVERKTLTKLESAFDGVIETLSGNRVATKIGLCLCTKRFETPIIVPAVGDVDVRDHDPNRIFEASVVHDKTIEALRMPLERLSQATGCKVVFHHGFGLFTAPYQDEPGVIHVFEDTRPSGDVRAVDVSRLFGERIFASGEKYTLTSEARGRGRIIRDAQKQAAGQLVGRNLFLLYPVFQGYFGAESRNLFHRVLSEAWKLLRKPERVKTQRGVRSAFLKMAGTWVDGMAAQADEGIRQAEAEIHLIQQKLADVRGLLRRWVIVKRSTESSPFLIKAKARIPEDYRRIRRLEGVVGIEVDTLGFQFRTAPITMTHAGHRYRLGTFTVRIAGTGPVAIWSDETAHPDGVPHPHVSKEGTACFGNATDAVSKLTSAFRFADAAELIMKWLREGYAPELATHPIEEWPIDTEVQDERREAELVADTGAVRPAGGPISDAHWSGRSGVLDGIDAGQAGGPKPRRL